MVKNATKNDYFELEGEFFLNVIKHKKMNVSNNLPNNNITSNSNKRHL